MLTERWLQPASDSSILAPQRATKRRNSPTKVSAPFVSSADQNHLCIKIRATPWGVGFGKLVSPEGADQRGGSSIGSLLQSSGYCYARIPRALPWAGMVRTVGAGEIRILKGIGLQVVFRSQDRLKAELRTTNAHTNQPRRRSNRTSIMYERNRFSSSRGVRSQSFSSLKRPSQNAGCLLIRMAGSPLERVVR